MHDINRATRQFQHNVQCLMDTILKTRFSDLDQDYIACIQLLEVARSDHDIYAEAFALAYLGDCYLGKNESIHANQCLLDAKQICEKYPFWIF